MRRPDQAPVRKEVPLVLRTVIAGCGNMAKGWLRALASDAQLSVAVDVVGLVDLDTKQAEGLAVEFGLGEARTGGDLDAMLAALKPDCVFDIVVPAARAGVVETALKHGAHVLSEKPMAASLAEARQLLALAERAGRVHAVVQNRRFIPGVRRMQRAVREGLVGEVTAIHCDFFIGAHFGGFREAMDHVLLLDMAIHTFDAIRIVMGRAPEAVYCLESNPAGSWYRAGAAANAIFQFAGGAVATYRGSWCAEGANTSWESRWRVIGTKGTLLWDGADAFEANVAVGGDAFLRSVEPVAVPEPADASATQGHLSVIRDFVSAVKDGRAPETAASDNIQSLAMVFAAIESAQTGRRVAIKP